MLYLTDFDGHLVNVEGSPVFDKKTGQVVGIRLPSVHSFNLFMGCSLMVPIDIILDALSNRLRKFGQKVQEEIKFGTDFSENVVKIKDGHLK